MALASMLHPALPRLTRDERRRALRQARRAPLDILELVAIAAGLIAAVLVMRGGLHGIGRARDAIEALETVDVAAGLALAASVVAAVLLRRTRRGLRHVLEAA
jgi:hypothetical protein